MKLEKHELSKWQYSCGLQDTVHRHTYQKLPDKYKFNLKIDL